VLCRIIMHQHTLQCTMWFGTTATRASQSHLRCAQKTMKRLGENTQTNERTAHILRATRDVIKCSMLHAVHNGLLENIYIYLIFNA